MSDIMEAFYLAGMEVEAKATAEGREATAEEHGAACQVTWDKWLNASIAHDMARAGFVRPDAGWRR